jgi:hypothetical protein
VTRLKQCQYCRMSEQEERSPALIELDDLLRLAELAADAEAEQFVRNPHGSGENAGRLRYLARRVDLLGRSLPVPPGSDPATAIRDYLAARRTTSARELAKKSAVLIDSGERVGELVWPVDPRLGPVNVRREAARLSPYAQRPRARQVRYQAARMAG